MEVYYHFKSTCAVNRINKLKNHNFVVKYLQYKHVIKTFCKIIF